MAIETFIKRTICVAECQHRREVVLENPPKERYCPDCGEWVPYKEEQRQTV
jgi:hypothetical protein